MKKHTNEDGCVPGIAGGNEEEYVKHLKYSRDFINPVQDEARRLSIDSAKKRAAAQHADYPTFASIVSAAHLKPFHRNRDGFLMAGEGQAFSKLVSPAWSFDARGGLRSKQEVNSNEILKKIADIGSENFTYIQANVPDRCRRGISPAHRLKENQQEEGTTIGANCTCFDGFMRKWRNFGRGELERKLDFLLQIGPQQLLQIFKVEIPPSVFADIVETVHRGYSRDSMELKELDSKALFDNACEDKNKEGNPIEEMQKKLDSVWVLRILEALGRCGRFSLSLKLMDHRARSMASELCSMVLINSAACLSDERNGIGFEEDRIRSFPESSCPAGFWDSESNRGSNIVEIVQKLQKLYCTEKDSNQKK